MDESVVYSLPAYFRWVFGLLMLAGGLAWMAATAVGFTRARAMGASTRWFALSALCMLLYHAHWLFLVLVIPTRKDDLIFALMASLNLFVLVGAVCATVGFARLSRQP